MSLRWPAPLTKRWSWLCVPEYYAHPTAVIDEGATIGAGSKVWHFSHVMAGARIGKRCVLGQNVYVGNRAVLGNGVKV